MPGQRRRYPLIGVAVAMAQFFAAGNLVAQRPMLTEPEKESEGRPGFYEYELSLGLGKSTVLLYYVLHNGIWAAVGLWLGAVLDGKHGDQPETRGLPDDALGHAIQAAWIGRKVPSPATSIALILGPRVDLLKDCIFTASVLQLAAHAEDEGTRQRGVCSLVTLFTPGLFLFCDGASRMEVAKECAATALLGDTEILAPLHFAARNCKAECVDFLLKAGAKKDVQGTDGETALDVAEGEFLPVAPRERPAAPRGPRGSQDQVRK
ncbi:unnamed protein product [Symbiodinium necroappetens]|uniref:Uncharacterized protein n=1 Tax=Symbiodinium necroappetens TaxID=1628268 RepID=A0A812T6N0_9DINO|nr:unnamed protein product [Symbiodinium necroappetens]